MENLLGGNTVGFENSNDAHAAGLEGAYLVSPASNFSLDPECNGVSVKSPVLERQIGTVAFDQLHPVGPTFTLHFAANGQHAGADIDPVTLRFGMPDRIASRAKSAVPVAMSTKCTSSADC